MGDRQLELQQVVDLVSAAVRLLALIATKGMAQKEQIATLSAAGFQPKQIAELIGTTRNTVSVALVEIRKNRKRRTLNRPVHDEQKAQS